MKRHVIAGRLGADDKVAIPVGSDEQLTNVQFVTGERSLDYGISAAIADLSDHGVYPSEVAADLLLLAAHVHAADTRISRATESQDSWTREIRLVVPVSDPQRWDSVADLLVQMLGFLTGDKWALGFRKRPKRFVSIVPKKSVLVPPAFDSVCLFSGGLDSLIGSIDLIESGKTPLLVSHAGEGATSEAQGALFGLLRREYKRSAFDRLRVWMAFPKDLVAGSAGEDTTRGRSFLFFALGVFAGAGLGQQFILSVPENGLIALNVPLDPLRLGSNSTRTTHPYYMARWNELAGRLGIACEIVNPYWNKTKGEMAKDCSNQPLLKASASQSLSCSSPAKGRWQGLTTGHCGYCLPCLIRRAALKKAWGRDPTVYSVSDLSAGPLDTMESVGKQVRSFQVAIERLKRQPGIEKALIHKPGSLADEAGREGEWAEVYRRGLAEVGALVKGVTTKPS